MKPVQLGIICLGTECHLRRTQRKLSSSMSANKVCLSSSCGYRKMPGPTRSPNDETAISAVSLVTNERLFLLTAG